MSANRSTEWRRGLEPDRGGLEADRGGLDPEVARIVGSLGRCPRKAKLRQAILKLNRLRAWRPVELAGVLDFSPRKLVERQLEEMVAEGLLERTHPDDRIEIHSIGDFPTGIRPELLTQEHRSIPRNPLIAGAFHRTGAIEVWGRGTNRVIEACCAYGIAEPTFTEASGAVTVTFEAEVIADLGRSLSQVRPKSVLSAAQVQVLEIANEPRTLTGLITPSGLKNKTRFRDHVVAPLLEAGLLEMTIPNKPRSSKQQYRTTKAGRVTLANGQKT